MGGGKLSSKCSALINTLLPCSDVFEFYMATHEGC